MPLLAPDGNVAASSVPVNRESDAVAWRTRSLAAFVDVTVQDLKDVLVATSPCSTVAPVTVAPALAVKPACAEAVPAADTSKTDVDPTLRLSKVPPFALPLMMDPVYVAELDATFNVGPDVSGKVKDAPAVVPET